MNIHKLLEDHRIPVDHPGDSNYRPGWVNVQCPFCGDHSRHLGFSLSNGYANCWRCGWHPTEKAISKLLNISIPAAKDLLKNYGGRAVKQVKETRIKIRTKSHKLPSGTTRLKSNHKQYLESRGFDPDKLEKYWKIKGTGPRSMLDNINYNHRILAPIFWEGKRVSWQARDITNRSRAKYMACPQDRELIQHQSILYGIQKEWDDVGICVEGITDVWRLGRKSFATFGIDYTHAQLLHIVKNFKRVIIIFDQGKQAQRQARKLHAELNIRGVEAIQFGIKDDPGAMTEQEAKDFVRSIY